MSYVCLSSPAWSTGAGFDAESLLLPLLPSLLVHAPRVIMDRRTESDEVANHLLWADARGLHAATLAEKLLRVLEANGFTDVRAGAAITPIAAEVASTWKDGMRESVMRSMAAGDIVVRRAPFITSVRPGRDRAFIADFPLSVLAPPAALSNLLDGIGVDTCGRLAALHAESVEVRLGAEGMDLWDRARAEDARWLFRTPLRSLPSASLEWTDYALRSSERLLFVINSLLVSVCESLVERGERARELSLVFSLVNRTQQVHPLRSSRPSADQKRWVRLVRDMLEKLRLPDAVAGIALRVESVTGNDGVQGDLFDRGFATAGAVEAALAQLADDHGELIAVPAPSAHPLADHRTRWSGAAEEVVIDARSDVEATPALTLQLLPDPRPITVATASRRDHTVPARYRDQEGWHSIVDAAGPDRVSGGEWDESYAREYFRCVREDGTLVWLFHTPAPDRWFLHGWWD